MLLILLTEASKIWVMCILAHLSGFLLGLTIMFYFYDKWAYKRFKQNDEQWKKIISEYQKRLEDDIEIQKDVNIDVQ